MSNLTPVGECERGEGCRFSHEAGNGEASYAPRRSGGSGVCYAFQKGTSTITKSNMS